ncbi:MAG: hypothetical protein WBH01_09655 [Dehalococcoidia bacterium]
MYTGIMRSKIVLMCLVVFEVLAFIWAATVAELPLFEGLSPIRNILFVSDIVALVVALLAALPGRAYHY